MSTVFESERFVGYRVSMADRIQRGRAKARAKTGRRPGRESSRGAVLDAARSRFARYGYDATTIRSVAADAGVDPALVMQFYGSKEGLFAAAILDIHTSSLESMSAVLAGPRSGMDERFTRAYFQLWEDPITGPKVQSLFRAIIGSPLATAMYRANVRGTVTKSVIPSAKHLRIMLAGTHLLGTAITRYILEVPQLAALSIDELVRLCAPAVSGHLRSSE
jgi:AcrR family transcriptional regulator